MTMNMIDSSFLCLDIGTNGVRGLAHRIKNARLYRSAYYSLDNPDTIFALKAVIDELEQQIGRHFDMAYITGNFGPAFFTMVSKSTKWAEEHKITATDIQYQISQIKHPENFYPMHILPLRYDSPKYRNMISPIGYVDTQLVSTFSGLYFSEEYLEKVYEILRYAHIQPIACYSPLFLQGYALKDKNDTTMFIDFGAESTTMAIWAKHRLVWYNTISRGGNDIDMEIADNFQIPQSAAQRIKHAVSDLNFSHETARFFQADPEYAFTCEDLNELVVPFLKDLISQAKTESEPFIEKYPVSKIIISGGLTKTPGFEECVSNFFGLPVVNAGQDATIRALSSYVWAEQKKHRVAYIARNLYLQKRFAKIFKIFHWRKKKQAPRVIPIMPSTMCFDMSRPETYTLFASSGISAIHVDIMDGLYVEQILGGLDDLRAIRANWRGHLHVHLMTEAPTSWALGAISAGADSIILSANTTGLVEAINTVRNAGKRVGVAVNPDTPLNVLKQVLPLLNEVMVMGVQPGSAGQPFNSKVLNKISILNETRKKYGLRYIISVDGGINPQTADACWAAGADLLVSGSFLANAPDFPLAVYDLIRNKKQTI